MIIFENLVFSKEKNRLETAHWAAAQVQYNTLWIIFRYFSVIWETTQIPLSGMFMMTFITDFLQRLLCFPNFYISHSQWGVFVLGEGPNSGRIWFNFRPENPNSGNSLDIRILIWSQIWARFPIWSQFDSQFEIIES